jgi:hypothetical protein
MLRRRLAAQLDQALVVELRRCGGGRRHDGKIGTLVRVLDKRTG